MKYEVNPSVIIIDRTLFMFDSVFFTFEDDYFTYRSIPVYLFYHKDIIKMLICVFFFRWSVHEKIQPE